MSDHNGYVDINTSEIFSISNNGLLKGKSAIQIARTYVGRKKNFTGENFWARGYYVSTAGRDEDSVREYIRNG